MQHSGHAKILLSRDSMHGDNMGWTARARAILFKTKDDSKIQWQCIEVRTNVPSMGFGAGRQKLRHHIRGDGIEIGALHNPFDLSDLPVTRVRYVDRLPVEQLRLQYPELNNFHFVHIDLIDDGQVLATIPDESLDFILANHMIEHCDDPLGALETWLSKLRCGGIVFMAVPDQRKGWDERREVTLLEHIVQDYRSTAVERKARNYQHFKSWAELVGNIHDEAHVQRLIDIDYSIHFHVFTFESFRSLLDYASREIRLPFRVVDAIKPSDCSWESVFVLEKTHPAAACGPVSVGLQQTPEGYHQNWMWTGKRTLRGSTL